MNHERRVNQIDKWLSHSIRGPIIKHRAYSGADECHCRRCVAVLHWLMISQSASLANVSIDIPARLPIISPDEYIDTTNSTGTITAIAYSPLAMMRGICVSVIMLVASVTVMQCPLKPGMPLVGSNSFAISAACHPPGGRTGRCKEENHVGCRSPSAARWAWTLLLHDSSF